jgi:hypothetical protein
MLSVILLTYFELLPCIDLLVTVFHKSTQFVVGLGAKIADLHSVQRGYVQ